MGAGTLVSLDEYLSTSYRPDVDFLDGELQERNMGERPHAAVQGFFIFLFRLRGKEWGVKALPEQRVQVTSTRYRIPDVCVVRAADPNDRIVSTPPLLCVEVLSSKDTPRSLQERVDDYFGMGVRNVWAVDPWQRRAYVCSPQGFLQPTDGKLRIEGTPIEVELGEVFAELDPQ